ncbi:hypothetical protein EDC51_103143 [Bibersteinia trehalosi]|uniref:hypothetical protein n=1 Tax=Bibersteinia trehalosi TaxID=47735 RepID=UPI0010477C0F|nr:hypothetical protein [Bibersteinia trehalosi]TCT17390.1 hypothetical protein EDC51_103143 [Bibersteinia trehalosi]
MKEISINDCQLIMGSMAFITRTMLSNPAVRTGATTGVSAYIAEQAYTGQDITIGGVVGYGAAGAIGGVASVANTAIRATKYAEIIGAGVGGGLIGTGNMINNSIKNQCQNNQSGSDYGDGCNYQ